MLTMSVLTKLMPPLGLFVFSSLLLSKYAICEGKNLPKIAIVGGGIGGASAAHYCRELFGKDTKIDLYEADQLGGRLRTVTIDGKKYDSGGTILHPRNFYMNNFTKMLELATVDHKGGVLGIYDGKEFVFTGSKYSIVMMGKLLWRYGYDVVRLNFFIQDLLAKFDRIYGLQDQGFAFTSTSGLLKAMSPKFEEMTRMSTKAALTEAGFSEKFIDELAGGALMSNYGQTTNVQGFVGSVSIAGAEPGLWSVEGGNNRVPQGLIKRANINLYMATVTDITLTGKQYEVQYLAKGDANPKVENYDIVIIATPIHQDAKKVQFHGFQAAKTYQDFHRTVATFVKGELNIGKFGYSKLDNFPTAILVSNPNLTFNSIGLQRSADQKNRNPDGTADKCNPVYKVFSQIPLTSELLEELFVTIESKEVVDWMAYPHYKSSETLQDFQLHDQLYYLNSIELAASCMETSAIAGRNVAILAFNKWLNVMEKIDNIPKTAGSKTEL